MSIRKEPFATISPGDLQSSANTPKCDEVCLPIYEALQAEISRLREENLSLRKSLALLKENVSLRSAHLIANVISWSDSQLSNQSLKSLLHNANTTTGEHTRSPLSSAFRPITPDTSLQNTVVQEISNTPGRYPGTTNPKPAEGTYRSISPKVTFDRNETDPSVNGILKESVRNSGGRNIPRVENQQGAFSLVYPNVDKGFEQALLVDPVTAESTNARSRYRMPSSSRTTGGSDRRTADRNKMYANDNTSEGYASQFAGTKSNIVERPVSPKGENVPSNIQEYSNNKTPNLYDKRKVQEGIGNELYESRKYTQNTDSNIGEDINIQQEMSRGQASDAPTYRSELGQGTNDGRTRVGEPLATSTPDTNHRTAGKSTDTVYILNRPVDQIIGVDTHVSEEHRQRLAQIKPSKRLVGEIAFQLDRRILDFVISPKSSADKSNRHKRYYGFSIVNIGQMIRKEATDDRGSFNPKKELEMRYRFDCIKKLLSSFGYCFEKHGHFSQDVVNKYGLLSGPPNEQTIKSFGLDDPLTLRLLLSQLIKDKEELENILVLLDCLCFLAHDDRRSIFLW